MYVCMYIYTAAEDFRVVHSEAHRRLFSRWALTWTTTATTRSSRKLPMRGGGLLMRGGRRDGDVGMQTM